MRSLGAPANVATALNAFSWLAGPIEECRELCESGDRHCKSSWLAPRRPPGRAPIKSTLLVFNYTYPSPYLHSRHLYVCPTEAPTSGTCKGLYTESIPCQGPWELVAKSSSFRDISGTRSAPVASTSSHLAGRQPQELRDCPGRVKRS